MADQREAILSRLVTVCGEVEGINAVGRNTLDVSEMLRPAVIVLDGEEQIATAALTDYRAPTVSKRQIMQLLPQIIVVLRGNTGAEGGTLLTLFRNRVLAAILNDAALEANVTSNGGIRYTGCVVPPPDAEGREFRIDLNLTFTYLFNLSELVG
jgi:hypothetical protein